MALKKKQVYSNRLVLDYPFHWTELNKAHIDANPHSTIDSPLLTQSIIRDSLIQHYYYFQNLVHTMSRLLGCPISIHSIAFAEATLNDIAHYESHTYQQLSLLSDHARISILLSDAFLNSFVHYALGCVNQTILSLSMTEREKKVVDVFLAIFLESFQTAWGHSDTTAGFHWNSIGMSPENNEYKSCFFMATVSIDGGDPVVIGAYYDPKTLLAIASNVRSTASQQGAVVLAPNTMAEVPVRMKGVLGKMSMSMSDLVHLQVGDVISLSKRLDDPVSIEIGTAQFDAVLGRKNQRLALKLLANSFNVRAHQAEDTTYSEDSVITDSDPQPSLEQDSGATVEPVATQTQDGENAFHAEADADGGDASGGDTMGGASEDDTFSWDDLNNSMISSLDDSDNDSDLESSFWLEGDDADNRSE